MSSPASIARLRRAVRGKGIQVFDEKHRICFSAWVPTGPSLRAVRSSLEMVHRTISFATRTAPHPSHRLTPMLSRE